MKILGNPWVTGALAFVAVAVVIHQFRSHSSRNGGQPSALSNVPLPEPVRQPVAPSNKVADTFDAPPPKLPPSDQTTIDCNYVQAHFTEWMEAPARDPFLFLVPGTPEKGVISPITKWKLKGIWRQTGSSLANINTGNTGSTGTYSEGDVVEGYKIEHIDADGVLFKGPAGRERLGFSRPAPPPK
jgi:hypothetical protein